MILKLGIIFCAIAAQVLGATKPCYRNCDSSSTHVPEIPSGSEIERQTYEKNLRIYLSHPVASVLKIPSASHEYTKGISGEYQGSVDETTGYQNAVGTFQPTDGVHTDNERYKREYVDDVVQQNDDLGGETLEPAAKPAECIGDVVTLAQLGMRILEALLGSLNN